MFFKIPHNTREAVFSDVGMVARCLGVSAKNITGRIFCYLTITE
jgi:hypothetical protein